MPRKLAEAAVRMRRASARLDILPTAARRRGFADAEFLPDVVLGVQLINQSCRCKSVCAQEHHIRPGSTQTRWSAWAASH